MSELRRVRKYQPRRTDARESVPVPRGPSRSEDPPAVNTPPTQAIPAAPPGMLAVSRTMVLVASALLALAVATGFVVYATSDVMNKLDDVQGTIRSHGLELERMQDQLDTISVTLRTRRKAPAQEETE